VALPQPLVRCVPGGAAVDNVVTHVGDISGRGILLTDSPLPTARPCISIAPSQGSTPRITLELAIEGVMTHAMVDINWHLPCVSPASCDAAPPGTGRLYRLTLILLAQEGDDLVMQATGFVPNQQEEESWSDLPGIMGLYGCLERVRFAVAPAWRPSFQSCLSLVVCLLALKRETPLSG
jgi:hypothetical protein